MAKVSLGRVMTVVALGMWASLALAPPMLATAPGQAAVKAPPARASAATPSSAPLPARGGSLVATLRSEPRSFNPHAGRDFATQTVAMLTQGRLVRVNRASQQVEPMLAERFT